MIFTPGAFIGAMNITARSVSCDRHRGVLAEEIVVRDRRRGRHHLGARHVDAGVGLLLDGDEHVLDLVGRLGAVDRRIDDGVVHEQDVVPAARRYQFLALSANFS